MFKITSERKADSQVLLNIEIEPDQVTKAIDRAYKSIAGRVTVPGFRRGKAPRHMIERFYGHDAALHEGVEQLLSEAYRAAVEQEALHPIDQPSVEFEPDIHSLKPGDGLTIRATVPVEPAVQLGDYTTIRIDPIVVDVTPDQVSTLVSFYQQRYAEWRPVERPVRIGDTIVADVTGTVGSATKLYSPAGEALVSSGEGDKLYDLTATEYRVETASRAFAPGFTEQVVGMHAGETKGFELSLPADHSDPQLANRMVTFSVKVREVKEEHLPALDDEFAKTTGFDSFEHFRETLKASIQRRMENEAREVYEERALGELLEMSQVEVAPVMIDNEVKRLIEIAREDSRSYGMSVQEKMRIDQATDEELAVEGRDRAIRNVKLSLLLSTLAEREAVSVSAEEVEQAAKEVAEMRALYRDRSRDREPARRLTLNAREREVLERRILRRKTVDRLIELAQSRAAAEAAVSATPDEPVAVAETAPSASEEPAAVSEQAVGAAEATQESKDE